LKAAFLSKWKADEAQNHRLPEDDLQRATEIAAARSGKRDYQVIEEALRAYPGLDLLERVGARSGLKEKQALALAYRESHQSRRP